MCDEAYEYAHDTYKKLKEIMNFPNNIFDGGPCKCGRFARGDGKFVGLDSGITTWWEDGVLHRERGPAIQSKDGYKIWCYRGMLSREGGPAVITPTFELWYLDGELHREDGPAIIFPSKVCVL